MPITLIKLIYNMINNRKFRVTIGKHISKRAFKITKGLQQGTVNSPGLFNMYSASTPKMFGLNSERGKYAITFADDFVKYFASNNIKTIKQNLQELYEKLKNYYTTWKLQINPSKCSTILFRGPLAKKTKSINENWKNPLVRDNEKNMDIPHERVCKYLGVNIDDMLNYDIHVKTQYKKALAAFQSLHKLFYSRHLNKKAKIIAYQSLIRPIITYACPIWYNISAGTMEKLRALERKILRACTSQYRDPKTNFKKNLSNFKLYEIAKIPRLDVFTIKLTRNHIKNSIYNSTNNLINGPFFPNPLYHEKAIKSGFVPPETFKYLDEEKYIVNENYKPILYHISRHNLNKRILYDPKKIRETDFVYSHNITEIDKKLLKQFSYYK